jgi:hypothetical protein
MDWKDMSKQQLTLVDVPKDASVKSHKAKLAEFKARAGIWTNNSGVKRNASCPDYAPWMAMLMPKDGAGVERYSDHRGYTKGSDEPFEIIWNYCRIMDETGRTGYGHTEAESIRNLCKDNDIPCEL